MQLSAGLGGSVDDVCGRVIRKSEATDVAFLERDRGVVRDVRRSCAERARITREDSDPDVELKRFVGI